MPEKKLAMLGIVNELLKTYFVLNQRHLCKSLMNAVNSPAFLPLNDFHPRQQVAILQVIILCSQCSVRNAKSDSSSLVSINQTLMLF